MESQFYMKNIVFMIKAMPIALFLECLKDKCLKS